jgi:hypothetical protein
MKGQEQSLFRQLQQTFSKMPPPAVFQTEAGAAQPAK